MLRINHTTVRLHCNSKLCQVITHSRWSECIYCNTKNKSVSSNKQPSCFPLEARSKRKKQGTVCEREGIGRLFWKSCRCKILFLGTDPSLTCLCRPVLSRVSFYSMPCLYDWKETAAQRCKASTAYYLPKALPELHDLLQLCLPAVPCFPQVLSHAISHLWILH